MKNRTLTLQLSETVSIDVGTLALSDPGITQTVAAMLAVIQASALDADVVSKARQLGEPQAIYSFQRRSVRFERDPVGVELLRTPAYMLDSIERRGTIGADCDDQAMLTCALLAVQGRRPVLIVVGREPLSEEGRLEHVFAGYMNGPGVPSRANVVPIDVQEGVFANWAQVRQDVQRIRFYYATGEHAAGDGA